MSSIRTSEVDDVVAIIKEEKQLQEDLKKLEKQIYGLETSYLESTSAAGNLVRGWGDTLSRPPSSSSRKKRKVAQEDRIFSLSSATAMQNNEQKDRHPETLNHRKKKTYDEW